MKPSDKARQITQWTDDVMIAIAKEAIGDRPP